LKLGDRAFHGKREAIRFKNSLNISNRSLSSATPTSQFHLRVSIAVIGKRGVEIQVISHAPNFNSKFRHNGRNGKSTKQAMDENFAQGETHEF